MLAMDRLFMEEPELRDITRQEHIKHPIGDQAELAIQAGNLVT